MAGVVIVAGLFPAGTVVDLVRVPDERTLRSEGFPVVGRRVVDEGGAIGFDGLTVGDRFIACGYADGRPLEVRCLAQDASAVDTELVQPPVGPVPVVVGTQSAVVVDPVPAVPSGLGVGVPAAEGDVVASEAVPAAAPSVVEAQTPLAGPAATVPQSGFIEVLADSGPQGNAAAQGPLVAQATGLGVENAGVLSVPELRQSILEKNATPVA